jgi:hypothetical protein
MASSYIGLYVQRLSTGVIHNVQIRDTFGGHETTMDPTDYVDRGIRPPIDDLPDVEDYRKAAAEPKPK